MSLVVAVPLGIGAAIVYGVSIVVQHRTAQEHAHDGDTNAASLLSLIRNPLWLIAVGSDFIGFLLQAAALSIGAVVVVQPLVVLMLPVALGVGVLGGTYKPRPRDYLGVVAIIGGLAVFLALIGKPHGEHVPHPRYITFAIVSVLLGSAAVSALVGGRNKIIRGATYGGAAGACFGTLAVMVDAASERVSKHGLHGLIATPKGLVPIAGIVVLGIVGIILTQMSFQVGALGATLPANLASDPLIAVLLGAVLLRERIPLSAWHIVAYILCLAAVVAGAIELAEPATGGTQEIPSSEGEASRGASDA